MAQFRITKGDSVTFQTKFVDTTTANEALTFVLNYLKGLMISQKDDIYIDKLRIWFLPRPLATKMEKTTRDEVLAESAEAQAKYIACFKAGLTYERKKGGLAYSNLRTEAKN